MLHTIEVSTSLTIEEIERRIADEVQLMSPLRAKLVGRVLWGGYYGYRASDHYVIYHCFTGRSQSSLCMDLYIVPSIDDGFTLVGHVDWRPGSAWSPLTRMLLRDGVRWYVDLVHTLARDDDWPEDVWTTEDGVSS